MKQNLVEKSLGKIKIFVQDFVPIKNVNLNLDQDFPKKNLFHFLWVKMLPKESSKIFRWPEMCPLGKILAQFFQISALTKILARRDKSVLPLLSTENCKVPNKNAQSMYGGDCDAAIGKAGATVTHVQSQNQQVGSGDEVLSLLCFDLSLTEK